MSEKKKVVKKRNDQIHLVDKCLTITTPRVSVHIESKDHRDDLEAMRKVAESIIDKYREGSHS
jgi:hypothetical protein